MPVAASKGVPVQLLSQIRIASGTMSGTAISIPISSTGIRIHSRVASTLTGTVVIEETMNIDPNWPNAWSTITTIDLSVAGVDSESVTHILGSFGIIRARISVALSGPGYADLYLVCN